MQLSKIFFLKKIISSAPIILLFISVLNEFDFNYLNFKYFSFNFPYILIFYWSLKGGEKLGYGLVFLAGLINDVVVGLPIGISSVLYLLICVYNNAAWKSVILKLYPKPFTLYKPGIFLSLISVSIPKAFNFLI